MSTLKDNSAAETAEQLHVQAGRRAPYTQVGDWVLLAPISDKAKTLYWALSAHINVASGNTEVWPTQQMLAEMLGLKRGDKLKPYFDELVAIDATEIRKSTRYAGGMRERSIYTIHQSPPEGYEHPESLKEFYAQRKAALDEKSQVARTPRDEGTRVPSTGGTRVPPTGGTAAPPVEGSNKTKFNETNGEQDEERAAAPTPPSSELGCHQEMAGHSESMVGQQSELVSNPPHAREGHSRVTSRDDVESDPDHSTSHDDSSDGRSEAHRQAVFAVRRTLGDQQRTSRDCKSWAEVAADNTIHVEFEPMVTSSGSPPF